MSEIKYRKQKESSSCAICGKFTIGQKNRYMIRRLYGELEYSSNQRQENVAWICEDCYKTHLKPLFYTSSY